MWTAKTISRVRDLTRQQRHAMPETVAFVPTMGALHKGHLSLIEAAKQMDYQVVVSIFVNPTQFGPGEDFERYPRQLEQDLAACERAGVAGVFYPAVAEMYPSDQLACELTVPALAEVLEGNTRPGHFAGVCRVVAKLLHIIEPGVACFGQKDYQQLKVIEAMVDDLAMPVRIVGLPTVREADGLAMSSRNAYLDSEARRRAVSLYKSLCEAKRLVEDAGESDPAVVEAAMAQGLTVHQVEVDYAVVRHPKTLVELDCIEPELTGGVVALVAGRVGGVRLIDNSVLGAPVGGS